VSVTVTFNDNEAKDIKRCLELYETRLKGVSLLPSGHDYEQAPLIPITKEKYEELVKHIHSIDLTKVIEEDDNTTLVDEIACGASGCEIK
jgi:hypothetical protein